MPDEQTTTRKRRPLGPLGVARKVVVWVLVPVLVHAAVIILLMQLQFLVAKKAKREAVIDTALEEIDIRDNPVEHLAPVNVKTSAMSDKKLDWREMLQPDNSKIENPDERNLEKMMEATQDDPLQLVKISIPTDGLRSMPKLGATQEGKRSVAAVVDSLSRELAKMLTKRNVLLVWLFDESGSTRRNRQEIRKRVTRLYGELQGTAEAGATPKLVSAVVGYGKEGHPLLRVPSANAATVQTAMDRIPIDTTGVENVMAAVRDVIKRYSLVAKRQRRALVVFIVTDEYGDDTAHLEQVVAAAKATRTRIFVLGSEAKFQKSKKWIWALSPKAPASVRASKDPKVRRPWTRPSQVDAGPEAAYDEILHGHGYEGGPWWQPAWTMSGFGFWPLSRLAKESGGVYYVLFGEKGPTYDPEVMAPYAPELCSRKEFIRRCKANRLRGELYRLHNTLTEMPLPGSFPVKGLRGALEKGKRAARKRVERLSKLLQLFQNGSLANAPTAAKRWEAIRELGAADCAAEIYSTHQYIFAIDDFLRRPKLSSRAISYSCGSSSKQPVRGGARGAAMRKAAIEKYQAVIAHHAGTPWAFVARRDRRLRQYGVGPKFKPHYTSGPPKKPPPPAAKM